MGLLILSVSFLQSGFVAVSFFLYKIHSKSNAKCEFRQNLIKTWCFWYLCSLLNFQCCFSIVRNFFCLILGSSVQAKLFYTWILFWRTIITQASIENVSTIVIFIFILCCIMLYVDWQNVIYLLLFLHASCKDYITNNPVVITANNLRSLL